MKETKPTVGVTYLHEVMGSGTKFIPHLPSLRARRLPSPRTPSALTFALSVSLVCAPPRLLPVRCRLHFSSPRHTASPRLATPPIASHPARRRRMLLRQQRVAPGAGRRCGPLDSLTVVGRRIARRPRSQPRLLAPSRGSWR